MLRNVVMLTAGGVIFGSVHIPLNCLILCSSLQSPELETFETLINVF